MPREVEQSTALAALRGLRTRQDVASFFDVSLRRFDYHLYVRRRAYIRKEIPKKTGGVRVIHAPPELIEIFQTRLAKYLRDAYARKSSVYGFCLGGGVARNATRHVRARQVLNLDLADFFDDITFDRVYGMFKSLPLGLPHAPAAMLAHLCCWNQRLPQGAPTSPIVSNWICRSMDTALMRLAKKHRCIYTRYADDITFSTRRVEFPPEIVKYRVGHDVALGDELSAVISANRFRVNERKVWMRSAEERQTVTGVVVNVKTNVPRDYRRELRAALHNWQQHGLARAQARLNALRSSGPGQAPPALPNYLAGKVEFLKQVRGSDDVIYARYALQLERLRRRDGLGPPRPVALAGAAGLKHQYLQEALWVIGAFAVKGHEKYELGNGTGFSLQDIGLVTNAHVLDEEGYRPVLQQLELQEKGFSIEFRARPATETAWQRLSVLRKSSHHDLAVLEPERPSVANLNVAVKAAEPGDEITVAGFPNWSEGDRLRIEPGTVTKVRVRSLVTWIEVSGTIHQGNSGGPILDVEGRVLGVATLGAEGLPMPHAAVSIAHLSDCT